MGKLKDTSKLQSFNSRAFGVEIEFVVPGSLTNGQSGYIHSAQRTVAIAIAEKANEYLIASCADTIIINAEGYNHTTSENWKIVYDSTANPTVAQRRDGYVGRFELVSPICKGEKSMLEIQAILKAMNDLDMTVSRHCGLHVHHDVRNWRSEIRSNSVTKNLNAMKKITNCITLVQKFENVIYGMLPASRRNGGWAKPLNDSFNSVFHCLNGKSNNNTKAKMDYLKANQKNHLNHPSFQPDRYCGLNFQSMFKHGTVEFRYGAPTLNFEKLSNWIVFTQAFVNMSEVWNSVNSIKEMKLDTKEDVRLTFEKMRDTLGLTKRMCQDEWQRKASLWARKRFDHFNN